VNLDRRSVCLFWTVVVHRI